MAYLSYPTWANPPKTYYVTLDLTTPNVEPRRRPDIKTAKADARGRWKNHGIASQRRDKPPSPKSYRYTEGGEDDPTATPATEPDNLKLNAEGDSEQGSPQKGISLKEEGGDGEDDDPKEEERPRPDPVQILDLHSETPMISYRGQVFSCEWALNSGTELLFMARDHNSQLPVLRSLPGEVDLLAASSCRLMPKAVTLEPKFNARNRMASDLPTRFDTGSNNLAFSIPVGPAASQKRKDQARFLEGLMAIKQEKGEEDEITVLAQKRLLNNKWKLILRKKRQDERNGLMKFIRDKAKAPYSWEEVERAKHRLQEMDYEDGTETSQVPVTGGGYQTMAYRSGRKRKAPPGMPGGRTGDLGTAPTATPSISTPTSLQLADSEAADELDGNTEYQEYLEDANMEDGEDSEGLYDEDDPESELYY